VNDAVGSLPIALPDAQRLLFGAVTDPRAAHHAALEPRLAQRVVENGMSAARRVAIYRDGYRARLVECLADDYPAVQHLLGAETFQSLCHDYIRDVAPGISLNGYGARFAEYCCHHAPRHARLANELAELEWALVNAVHASDAQQLTPEQLAAFSRDGWEDAVLVPSPTLSLLSTTYPVNAYLQRFRDGQAIEPPEPAPSWVVVCRSGIDVWRIDLPSDLGRLFACLASGERLAAALASATFREHAALDPAATIQQAFSQWMRAGCFSGVKRADAG